MRNKNNLWDQNGNLPTLFALLLHQYIELGYFLPCWKVSKDNCCVCVNISLKTVYFFDEIKWHYVVVHLHLIQKCFGETAKLTTNNNTQGWNFVLKNVMLYVQSISHIWAIKICLWWFDFMLEAIYTTPPAASKNADWFKSGQNWLKNNHLASLIQIHDALCANLLNCISQASDTHWQTHISLKKEYMCTRLYQLILFSLTWQPCALSTFSLSR
jgi:hypothetical protein